MGAILDMIRRSVPPSIKQPLKKILGVSQTRLHPHWRILSVMGPNYGEHVIVDVGAHSGWFFHCWLDWCPRAQVHAFEPYPPSFDAASKNYGADPRVRLVPMAVGDATGQKDMNILQESLVSNSLLTPAKSTWEQLRYETGNVTKTRVPVTTLDCYAAAEGLSKIHLIKIDVQGYEMHVLRGAEKTLPNVDFIFIESGIQPLYIGAPRFTDVFNYLSDRNFHLMAMQAWHRGNHVLMEADMLFRSNNLMPPVDETIVRVTERTG
jgi:FkbM family methyltransferase